jgi:hypothetical protein
MAQSDNVTGPYERGCREYTAGFDYAETLVDSYI